MDEYDHITFHELSLIEKIIRDETWLEGERRGCFVPSSDIVVRANVCVAVLRMGTEFRKSAMRQIARAKRKWKATESKAVHHNAA
jgi:hypothetical protein